jgi:hypothetical protein
MSKLLLPRDQQGNLILPGRVKRQIVWPLVTDTTIPTGLTNTSGSGSSVTFSNTAAGTGGATFTSVNGATAQLKLSQEIRLDAFESVLWEVHGIKTSDSNTDNIAIGLYKSGAGAGAYAYFGSSSQIKYKEGVGSSETVSVNAPLLNGTGANSARNLGLLILPKYGQIYLMEDDQVLCNVSASATDATPMIVADNCLPDIAITSSAGTTAVMVIQQIRLTLYSY